MKIQPLGNRQNGSFSFDGYLIKRHIWRQLYLIINEFLFDRYLMIVNKAVL